MRRKNGLYRVLGWVQRAPDTDNTGGGGGGSAKDKPASGVTMDQVHEAINGALGKIKTTVMKDVEKLIVTTVTSDESPIMKAIGEITGKVEAISKNTPKDKDAKKPSNDDDDDLPPQYREQFEAMKKQAEKQQKLLDAMEAEKKANAKKTLDDSRRTKVADYLKNAGFGERAKFVLADHWGNIQWEDDTAIDLQNAKIKDANGQEISYKDFIEKQYVKSDEGKGMLVTSAKFGSGAGEPTADQVKNDIVMEEDEINKQFDKLVA